MLMQLGAWKIPDMEYLSHIQGSLSKRAYLARFLRNVEVPEENFADNQVVELYRKYKELQEEFKTNHKIVDKLRQNSVDPAEIKRELQQLELEKKQLQTKLKRLNSKVKHSKEYQDVDFAQVLAQTHALREQQEEEHRLMEQLEDQKRELIRNQHRRHQTKMKFEQQSQHMTNPKEVMESLEEEVKKQKVLAEVELPKQIEAQEEKIKELDQILSASPMTEEEVAKLERIIEDTEDRIQRLTNDRNRAMEAQNSRIGHIRDSVNAQVKQMEKRKDKLEELLEDKRESEADLRSLQTELAAYYTDDRRPKNEQEMQKYMIGLKAKTRQYGQLAEELQLLKRELLTLSKTEEILRSRDANIREFNLEMEKKHGLEGYQDTKDKLEAVSTSKANVDYKKEATLAEVSALVQKIKKTLDDKKGTMGPQIKRLREVRRRHQEILKTYETKRNLHNNTYAGLRSERIKLEKDVERNLGVLREEQRNYHIFHANAVQTQARLLLVEKEAKFVRGEEKLGQDGAKTFQELLGNSIKALTAHAKELRTQQKSIKENHIDKLEQRKMFEELNKIITLKHKLAVEAKTKEEAERTEGTNFMQIADDLTDTGMGERMIINN
uniref:Uncharacterized protein n=1 Tax=Lotharella globosa TaxID=91324 RepID=A0A7S4DYM7_9EUKA